MANDRKGSGAKGAATGVAQVEAGTTQGTFRVVTPSGAFREFPPSGLFKAGGELQLGAEEGEVTFVDVAHKDQTERRMKLEDPKGDGSVSRFHQGVLFFSPVSKKYGGICACSDCGVPVRKWTSDMHQSERCAGCGVKAKRKSAKSKRAAKPSSVAGALPVTAPEVQPVA